MSQQNAAQVNDDLEDIYETDTSDDHDNMLPTPATVTYQQGTDEDYWSIFPNTPDYLPTPVNSATPARSPTVTHNTTPPPPPPMVAPTPNEAVPSSTPPGPPGRYVRQRPSSNRKIVYVIYGGPEPGLWYNWPALRDFRSTLRGWLPETHGYESYQEAERAFQYWQRTGHVPHAHDLLVADVDTLESPRSSQPPPSPRLLTSIRMPTVSTTPSRRANTHGATPHGAPISPSPLGRPALLALASATRNINSTRPSPQRGPAQTEASPTVARDTTPVVRSSTTDAHTEHIGWFVVLQGLKPGVFPSIVEATEARGNFVPAPLIYPFVTRPEADRFFVDSFEAHNVKRLRHGSAFC
ncbi:hypothetical protein CPB83DRAFT_658168 [Crepidotus variabilis]|uniref:Uncharacterized protein n=1 Tax=Crepidotus variabilis TaxID=179855 RepID=A0A9P6E718_9AGAR|nr:hypothetical protein CPB83DRAFT_658168 [Crepidotus variabilis]